MNPQAFTSILQRNHTAMKAAGEVTRITNADGEPRRGRNGRCLHTEEKKLAAKLWAEIRHRMTRQEACRQIASVVRKETGNQKITEAMVLGWARRGEFDHVTVQA